MPASRLVLPALFAGLASTASLGWASEASANPGITGYSGKPYPGVANEVCSTTCHANGGGTSIAITAPATMKAGASETITVKVNGTRARTSMNAAFSAGSATAGTNTVIPFPTQPDEIGAVDPPPVGANGTFTFSYKAPNQNGTVTMYVAAVSSNNNSAASGDGVATTKQTITITGATTSDAGADGGSSGTSGTSGGTSGSSGGTSGASGTSGGTSGASSGTSGSTSGGDDDDGTRPPAAGDSGGCTTSGTTSDTSSWALLAAASTAAVLFRLRGRRRAPRSA